MKEKRKKKRFLNQDYAMMRYKEGATDQEIADETGVSKDTAALFRKRLLLPPNQKMVEKKAKEVRKMSRIAQDNAEARKQGLSYVEYMGKFYWPLVTGKRRKLAWKILKH